MGPDDIFWTEGPGVLAAGKPLNDLLLSRWCARCLWHLRSPAPDGPADWTAVRNWVFHWLGGPSAVQRQAGVRHAQNLGGGFDRVLHHATWADRVYKAMRAWSGPHGTSAPLDCAFHVDYAFMHAFGELVGRANGPARSYQDGILRLQLTRHCQQEDRAPMVAVEHVLSDEAVERRLPDRPLPVYLRLLISKMKGAQVAIHEIAKTVYALEIEALRTNVVHDNPWLTQQVVHLLTVHSDFAVHDLDLVDDYLSPLLAGPLELRFYCMSCKTTGTRPECRGCGRMARKLYPGGRLGLETFGTDWGHSPRGARH